MSTDALLHELRDLGVVVALVDDELEVDAPAGVLTEARLSMLRAEKPALLDRLRDEAEHFDERAAIREYDGGYLREEAERLAGTDIAGMVARAHGEVYG